VTEYVGVRTQDGEVVPFEIDETEDGPVMAGRRWDAASAKAEETFEAGVERATAIARSVVAKMASISAPRPDKVAVEIGLKVSAGAGVVIAKCSTEAHVKITVEWHGDGATNSPKDEDLTSALGEAAPSRDFDGS
jgi:hypothetical protein